MTGATPPAGVAETHSAVVFFFGDRAYKVKKPVDLGFLDFRSRERREAVCHREVALNRRLAPDVYLGVADVVGPDGAICDHLVVMRRMPDDRRLSTLVRAGADVDGPLREVAGVLARFHATADRGPAIDAVASRDGVAASWESNLAELEPFVGRSLPPEAVTAVARLARRWLAGRGPLFDERLAAGWARDGHGDLLADDVFCLDDGPRILDCLEFDDRLRSGDVLLDAAFLAMDLERLGRPDLGERFLRWWSEDLGECHPASLADHYAAYRALVRSKVAAIRADQGDAQAAGEARRLLDLCRERLARARVRLVLVGGLPGTGKSTLAAGLGASFGFEVLRSDEVRKELAGIGRAGAGAAPLDRGIYDAEHTARTYAALIERARPRLERGLSVVLDASWTDPRWRERAAALAEATASDLVELRCEVDPAEARCRIVRRSAAGGDPSDATPEVAEALARRAAPWPSAVTIDTSSPAGLALAAAEEVVRHRAV